MTIPAATTELDTPDVTAVQKGAAVVYAAVAAACITAGVTGTDLLAYLGSATIVTGVAIWSDHAIRVGRATAVAANALSAIPGAASAAVTPEA